MAELYISSEAFVQVVISKHELSLKVSILEQDQM